MRYSFILSLISCLLIPSDRWFPEYPKDLMRFGYERTVDKAGNVYIVTVACDPNARYAYRTTKYDTIGQELWHQFGPNVMGLSTSFSVVSADGTGNVYSVFGTHIGLSDGTIDGCTTEKYSSHGQKLWSAPSRAGEIEEVLNPVHAVVDNRDNLYVVGYYGAELGMDISVEDDWFDDACGAKAKTRAERQERRSEDVETFRKKHFSSGTSASDIKPIIVKYDPGGRKLWTRRYEGRWNWDYWPADAEVDTKGNLYVVGWTVPSPPSASKLLIIKYDEKGKKMWDTQYARDDESNYLPADAVLDAAGHLYVVGTVGTMEGSIDLCISRHDSQSKQEWTTTYREQGRDYVSPCAVTLDSKRNLYVTILACMSPWRPDTWDEVEPVKGLFVTLKYDRQGQYQEVMKYKWPSGRKMWIQEIIVDKQDHLHALGFSASEPIAIEYDENGSKLSVRQFRDLPSYVRFLSNLKQSRKTRESGAVEKPWNSTELRKYESQMLGGGVL